MMNNRKWRTWLPLVCLLLPAGNPVFGQKAEKTSNYVNIPAGESPSGIVRLAAQVTPSPRQLRWQELELTAFFHFGVNTFSDREWGDGTEKEEIFNPTGLDANQWVSACKEAGIKQVILTAKHHDGFCLWPSALTEHSVRNSPWKAGKGDVVREVADACHRYDMGFGVYLSPWDRNSRLYGTEAYNDYFVGQLTELLTKYGRVDEVWFDGACGEGPNGKKQEYDFERWYKVIRQLQPSATIAISGPDVRWVGTESGYGRETEWSVIPVGRQLMVDAAKGSQTDVNFPPVGDLTTSDLGSRKALENAKSLVWYPAETDVSIRPGWFFHDKENAKVKSGSKLMDIYFHSVGRNGVLLLNIPPDRRGLLHESDVKALKDWKKLRDDLFKINLASGAKIGCDNGSGLKLMLDDDPATCFTTTGSDTTTVITFRLKGEKSFNLLLLREDIRVGQRVEQFLLEYKRDGLWVKAAEGTTVGYKRLLQFPEITASQVRLSILSSRLNPTIAEFGLYKYQDQVAGK